MSASARRLRWLHLHSTFAAGGKEARAVRLMNAFGRAVEHVVVSGVPQATGAASGLKPGVAVRFPENAPSLRGRPGFDRFRRLVTYMQGFDLVLSYNWGAMDAVMARTLFTRALPLPPLIHHEDGFNEDEVGGLKTRRNWFRMIALGATRALVVPSVTLEKIALERWKQPEAKVHRIPNGIDVERFATRARPRPIPGLERRPGELVVGTVAGLRAVKDLPLLVRAVAQTGPGLRLVIVGDGPERVRIEAAAAEVGLGDRLVMPGHMAEPERWLRNFDLFALSSASEQAPIALVEAMAAGLPVAATDVGDVATMLSAVNRNFVAPSGDAAALGAHIAALAADEGLRRTLGEANQARAGAEFNEDRMIERYRLLYGAVMGRPDFARH